MNAWSREMMYLAAVASVVLFAGCGGGAPKSDAGSAPADTATPVAPPAPTPAPADTTTKADTAAPKPTAAKPAAPKPSTQKPAADTATQTASADAPLRDLYHPPPRDTVTQEVYNGWKQFNLNCARCHGEDVIGTTIAPHLIMSLKPDGPVNTKELFVGIVCAGRPEKGMPAWCALGMEMDKIQEIYAYVKGRSEGKLAPGRPAVRTQG